MHDEGCTRGCFLCIVVQIERCISKLTFYTCPLSGGWSLHGIMLLNFGEVESLFSIIIRGNLINASLYSS